MSQSRLRLAVRRDRGALFSRPCPLDAALSRPTVRVRSRSTGFPPWPGAPGDAAAISWLSNHAGPTSVVLEARRSVQRVCAHLLAHGIPTVMAGPTTKALAKQRAGDRQRGPRECSTAGQRAGRASVLPKIQGDWVVLGTWSRRYPEPTASRRTSSSRRRIGDQRHHRHDARVRGPHDPPPRTLRPRAPAAR